MTNYFMCFIYSNEYMYGCVVQSICKWIYFGRHFSNRFTYVIQIQWIGL